MKIGVLLCSVSLSLASFAPAVELVVQPRVLNPQSTLEVRFDTPMVSVDRVGREEPRSPLILRPDIEGVFKWTSTRSGQFRFTRTPAMGATYGASLRVGLTDAGGRAVEKKDFGDWITEAFRVVEQPRYYWQRPGRNGALLVQFNDAVDVASVSANAMYSCGSAPDVAAVVRPATGKDFRKFYERTVAPTWEEQAQGITPQRSDGQIRSNAFVMEAKVPLPVGSNWTLILSKDIRNASGTATLGTTERIPWGSVLPLKMVDARAVPHFERRHEIFLRFNKPLVHWDARPEDAAREILRHVHVEPAVANLDVVIGYDGVGVVGDYKLDQMYKLTVDSDLAASDGVTLDSPYSETLVFHPSPAFVSTTAFDSLQLANGKGLFDIYAGNFANLRVRVKQLGEGELIHVVDRYQEYLEYDYRGRRPAEAYIKDRPFEELPGLEVFDKTYSNDEPLEKGTMFRLNWHEILGKTPAAPVFAQIEVTPQPGAPKGKVVARAIVQFTDLGVFVKDDRREALVYVFSLTTGEPLPGVNVNPFNSAKEPLQGAQTDAAGIARIPSKNTRWILAKKDADCTALNFERHSVDIWQAGISVAWSSPWQRTHQTFLYADRPVYKPGDVAHVRGISRILSGDVLSLGDKPFTAQMNLTDPRGRVVSTKKIVFSSNGTWSDDLPLPETTTGWYHLTLDFADEKKGEDEDEEYDRRGYRRWRERSPTPALEILVDDYKPNTFEVKLDGDRASIGTDRITVPLKARYYMGKALSTAKLSWSASLQRAFTPPEKFADYHFGDVPDWYHYGEDRDEDAQDGQVASPDWGVHGEMALGDDGTAEIQLPPPPPTKAALPQTITVNAEVTDVNQQTISAISQVKVPGADYVIGEKTSDWYGRAGHPMSVHFVAITPQGDPLHAGVGVDVKIERQEWNTVRILSAGGADTPKNQTVMVEEGKASLTLGDPAKAASEEDLTFTPQKGGTYFVTATGRDSQGREVFTRLAFYVLGGSDFPWAYEQGNQIALQPDKTSVKPGDVVTLVVKTPFAGNALVSVERNRVHRTFTQPISPESPLVRVPIQDEDAPNVFISVLVVRGASHSNQPGSAAEYRLGYAAINVVNSSASLRVNVQPDKDTIKPGEALAVYATVKDSADQSVADAEVNLYAVDEGVLSLMAYATPQPGEFFHQKSPLGIRNFTALDELLTEDEKSRVRGNKGFMVGGGGDASGADAALRKNFVATAVWCGALITDRDGRVSTVFKAPDSLTRYRIMAVALKGADRFGSGEAAFTVNKPLMVEPVVPKFAHTGDELLLKAVLHNTTKQSGTVEVELRLDDSATVINEPRPFALVGLQNRILTNDGRSDRRMISLKAGETVPLAFPVRFVKQGACALQWTAHTTKWTGEALSDAVESKFEITPPAPALREVHYFQLSGGTHEDLLKDFNPQLLEAGGELLVSVTQSRMGEVRDALEYLLHYPYGCVEQTTSSTLPWVALAKYEPLYPDLLQAGKVRRALERGRDRLLSMQTESGGLAYWPGGLQPLLWASAYGGFGLVKIKEAGVDVPEAALEKLTTWMRKELGTLHLGGAGDGEDFTNAALALYTLAKAGQPESSYQTLLFDHRNDMPEIARLYLALALGETHGPTKEIEELLRNPRQDFRRRDYWLGGDAATGLRLLANVAIGNHDAAQETVTEVLNRRDREGRWGTTFSNVWVLLGLSSADSPLQGSLPAKTTVHWKQATDLVLGTPLSTATQTFLFDKAQLPNPLYLDGPAGRSLAVRLEVKSWPDIKTLQPVSKGFDIQRTYERLTPTGDVEPAKDLRVGDLVVVTLHIGLHESHRYLAVEDPLPSVFEPVNPEFATQHQTHEDKTEDHMWYCDYRELRNDRALFFTNEPLYMGNFTLRYLARVIAEGDVLAPSARIEAMYEPDHYGLSGIDRVQTLPMSGDGRDVAKK